MGGIRINKAYAPLITSKKRYFLLTGGRASLKSTTIHDFASRLTYEKRHGILITRYTMSSAEKSIIPEFESSIKLNNIYNSILSNIAKDKKASNCIIKSKIEKERLNSI